MRRAALCLGAWAMVAVPVWAEQAAPVQWSGKDVRGTAIQVPAAERPSVLLFVMPEQSQSQQALKDLAAVAKGEVQVAVILSGDQAAKAGKLECSWPVVADAEYAVSGRLAVRVWPTTVIVDSAGQVVAHLAGLPKNYDKELESYLAFARKQIDQATLEKRLANHDVVVDSADQIASRHLQVAQRLMDKGLAEQARTELAEGLKQHPQSPELRLGLVRAHLALGEAAEALKALEALENASPAQVALLKGKASITLGKWDDAAASLKECIKLNPQPAEAWYELGRVYQHAEDWAKAADAFRHAFESTDTGRKTMPATQANER